MKKQKKRIRRRQ